MTQSALDAKTCQIEHTWSALMRSIRGCWLASEEKSGSGDTIRPLAGKGLFLTLAGKFTKKTLARASNLVVGRRCPGRGTPGHLFLMTVRISCGRDAESGASPGATSGPRDIGSGAFPFVAQPTCAILGALSLIGSNSYNHLLFTVSLYRIGVLGFWGTGSGL